MTTQGSDFERSPDDSPDSQEEADGRLRLHKLLAHRGVASRRKSEQLIAAGSVTVDGEVVTEPGTRVDPTTQEVLVDGRPLPRESETFLFLFYKPKGVVSTLFDPEGRPTLKDYFPGIDPILHIGRLDFQTEGALLLTNNGDLSQRILHPRFEIPRTYLVKIQGGLTPAHLERMARGDVRLDGRAVLPLELVPERQTSTNAWYRITLTEGRNREVRRLFESLNYFVLKLVRTAFGPLTLSGLEPGEYRTVTSAEIDSLLAGSRPQTHSKNLDSRYKRDSERNPGRTASRAGDLPDAKERSRRPASGADRPTRTGSSPHSFRKSDGSFKRTDPKRDFDQPMKERDFSDRTDRSDQARRTERSEWISRSDRPDRSARPERSEQAERPERRTRSPQRSEGFADRPFGKDSESRPPRERFERDRTFREPRRERSDSREGAERPRQARQEDSAEHSSRSPSRPYRSEARPPFRKTDGAFKRPGPKRDFSDRTDRSDRSDQADRAERSERTSQPRRPGRSDRSERPERRTRPPQRSEGSQNRPFGRNSESRLSREGFDRDRTPREPRRERSDSREGAGRPRQTRQEDSAERSSRSPSRPFRSDARPPFRKADGAFKRTAPKRDFDQPDRPARPGRSEQSDRPERRTRPPQRSEGYRDRSLDKNSGSRPSKEGVERDRSPREPRRERSDSREGAERKPRTEGSSRFSGKSSERSDSRTSPKTERGGPRKSSAGGYAKSSRPSAGKRPSSSGPKRPGSPSGKRGGKR